jgi:hypothetical protein
MESLLVGVTVISLLLAVTMSAIAWSLWQADRERTAARAEALEAMAFSDRVEDRAIAPTPAAATRVRTPAHGAAPPARYDAAMLDETPSDETWDYALGGTRMDDADLPTAAPRAERTGVLPDSMFHATERPSATSGRLWLALAAVALIVTAGVVLYRAAHTPEILAVVSTSRTERVPAAAAENAGGVHALELLSLRHAAGADGAFTVMGLVQNPADGETLDQVEAVLYLFDADGRYFANGKAPLDVPAIAPGDESPFTITVAASSGVSRYRVGFRRGDGHVLAHVDRRGQLPGGTSGDAIDAQPAFATPAGAIRRTEGAIVQ